MKVPFLLLFFHGFNRLEKCFGMEKPSQSFALVVPEGVQGYIEWRGSFIPELFYSYLSKYLLRFPITA